MLVGEAMGAALAGVLLGGLATASATAPAIEATQAWSRPAAPGAPTGVVYLTLANRGGAADRLTGASTPVARAMALHRSSMTGGIMSMAAVPGGLEIPPRGQATLSPGGYHFMLVGLKAGLVAGTRFPATLRFAHGPPVRIEVAVRAVAPEPAMAGMAMH